MKPIFITSTGTDVGKTFVATTLIRQLQEKHIGVAAIKPVISDFTMDNVLQSDTGQILKALGHPVTLEAVERISPWRFMAPLSPDMAAVREKRTISFDALIAFCQTAESGTEDILLIEGVGGVMVPLDHQHTVADWIAALSVPCLLVTGSYLGTLSHTLTAAAVLEKRGTKLLGVIISESVQSPTTCEEIATTLSRFLPDTQISILPRDPGEEPNRLPDLTGLVG